jgi:ribonuclease Z
MGDLHYPVHAVSFMALERFSKQFDPQADQTVWVPATEGDEIAIAKDLLVLPARNGHVPVEQHIFKSLGYTVVQTRKKLKTEYTHLSGEELRQLGENLGRENLSHELRENLLAYSGDTPVEDGAKWDGTRILIHEATFLGHFSSRYSPEEIDSAIKDRCDKYAISFPAYRVLPGETVFDILGGRPLNR